MNVSYTVICVENHSTMNETTIDSDNERKIIERVAAPLHATGCYHIPETVVRDSNELDNCSINGLTPEFVLNFLLYVSNGFCVIAKIHSIIYILCVSFFFSTTKNNSINSVQLFSDQIPLWNIKTKIAVYAINFAYNYCFIEFLWSEFQ